MVQRIDPARTGVKAGRIVGGVTAVVAAVTILRAQESIYASAEQFLAFLGVSSFLPLELIVWANVVFVVVARYSACYVIGSLIGVVYDWLDRPSLLVLTGLVLIVAVGDGFFGTLDTGRPIVGGLFAAAWFLYLPAFVWLFDDSEHDEGPVRLGSS